jgi:hypothetical protein
MVTDIEDLFRVVFIIIEEEISFSRLRGKRFLLSRCLYYSHLSLSCWVISHIWIHLVVGKDCRGWKPRYSI